MARGPAAALLCVCALAWAGPAYALTFDTTPTDLRLTLSADFQHASGATVLAGRYGGAWGVRAAGVVRSDHLEPTPHWIAGFDHVWTSGNWRAGFGLVWIDEKTNINGTKWLFDLSLGYDLSRHVFVEYRHHSHGSKLGIQRNVPNGGWNLIGVGLRFE